MILNFDKQKHKTINKTKLMIIEDFLIRKPDQKFIDPKRKTKYTFAEHLPITTLYSFMFSHFTFKAT